MASVFLAELDADVIGLGEDCTNPLFAPPKKAEPPKKAGGRRRMRMELSVEEPLVEVTPGGGFPTGVMRTAKDTTKAVVSVADCLACSGCVTSAEAVLVNAQSASKFAELCGADGGAVRVFVGLAALASFGERLGCAPARAYGALRGAL